MNEKYDNPDLGPIELQIIAITDFHGYIRPYDDTANGQIMSENGPLIVGGAAYMATHIKRLREEHDNTLLLSVGDNFSGWPFEVAAFKNEPTIEFLNAIGVDVSAAGNHEFDVSADFLIDYMMKGQGFGVPDVDSCFTDSRGKSFQGCNFEYISANVRDVLTDRLILKPYFIKHIPDGRGGTVPVGIIGLLEEGAFTKEQMSIQAGALYADSLVESANRYAKELQEQGVEAIIALVHEGGTADSSGLDFNGFDRPRGPVIDFAKEVSPAIDVILTGHWHAAFNCSINDPDGNPRPVVEGSNHGRLITEILLSIDPVTRDVIREKTKCINHPNTRDVPPDPEISDMVSYWVERAKQKWAEPVAELTGDLVCERNEYGESPLANVVADSFYATGKMAPKPADFAITTGVPKRDLRYAKGTDQISDGIITFGELLESIGAHTSELVVTLSGWQLKQAFEEQWSKDDDGANTFNPFNVSYNIQYTYDLSKPLGERIDPSNVWINRETLDINRSYRVAVSGLIAVNGGGYPSLSGYTDAYRIASWPVLDYVKSLGVIQVPKLNRIRAAVEQTKMEFT